MVEMIEEQNAERPDIDRYLDVLRRRYLHLLIPLFCTWLIVWGASWVMEPRFKSSTLILVEQPTMPKNYVEPNVSDDLQDRLQSITQQILSRTRLLLIIQKLHLYSDIGGHLTDDELVERMRKDIDIELVRDTRNNEITAFRIYFSSRDPHLAQQVTNELTALFINENLRVRQEESEGTTKFIQAQLEDARVHLSEQEAKVRAFEGVHEGALPSQQTSNLQILGGLQSQLQSEQDALNSAKQQRAYLQSMVEQNRIARGSSYRTGETPSSGLAALDLQLRTLRAQLVDLSSRYTDQYPDVQKLKDQIAKTQHLRDELVAYPGKEQMDEPARDEESSISPISQLQGQLHANQLEISNREQAIAGLKQRINEYQSRLNEEPSTEQELAELTRGYEQSKANYDALLKKKNDSQMATSMEQMQQGERFTMLDPPSLPTKPDFPNRLKFCGIGLGLGLVLGVAVAGGFELLDDRLHGEKEIRDLLPIGIIAEIPEIVIPSDEIESKRRLTLGWTLTAAVFVTIVAGAAISFFHG
jgi:polysaccharide chain length determinant protein (PEP-CTERM system associated)